MITIKSIPVLILIGAALAYVTAGVHVPFDVFRIFTIGLGAATAWAVMQAGLYRSKLIENSDDGNLIIVKEFILAGFVLLNCGTIIKFIGHSFTLISPLSCILFIALLIVHLKYHELQKPRIAE